MHPHMARWVALGMFALLVIAMPLGLLTLDEHSGWLPCTSCQDLRVTAQWVRTVSGVLVGLALLAMAALLWRGVPRGPALQAGGPCVLLARVLLAAAGAQGFEVLAGWMPEHRLSGWAAYLNALSTGLIAGALFHALPRGWAPLSDRPSPVAAPSDGRAAPRTGAPAGPSVGPLPCVAPSPGAGEASGDAPCRVLEEVRRTIALRDTFLAMVAHELRTPLQSSLYWAELLRRPNPNPALVADAAQHIVHNVLVQSRLVGDLLDISRVLTGQLRLELQQHDAVAVVNHAVDIVQAEARARHIHIDFDAPDHPVPMLTDPFRLEQVAWNLISNAVHASRDGSRVAVSLAATEQRVQLVVQDQGVGIAPHDLGRLFDPFHQGEARAVRHGGLGLGLPITAHIVQQLGGQVTAHSDGLGLGARFTVDLPRQPPVAAPG